MHHPAELLERFPSLTILVVGDAVLDVWMYAGCSRLSREAPVPVLDVTRTEPSPGAAANAAANAAALGARVEYVGVLGADADGEELRRQLAARGVGTGGLVTDPSRGTTAKRRVVCDGQVMARFDSEPGRPWSAGAREELAARVSARMADADCVLVSDYGDGALADPLPQVVAAGRRVLRGPLVVDGHRFERWRRCRPTAMTPSAAEVLGTPDGAPADGRRVAELTACSGRLLDEAASELLLTSLDAEGTLLHPRGHAPHRTRAVAANRQSACGAGDTLAAAFTLALTAGAPPTQAADLAQEAANVVVGRPGTTCCSAQELGERLAARPLAGRAGDAGGRVLSAEALAESVRAHRAAGRRIVFTNGCFDVVHVGHAEYLQQAAALGEVLVVALNSDRSVRRLKGPDRPIVPEGERAAMVAALRAVDHVVLFDDPTPERLLEVVRPDVYVKGGDYTPEMLPETEVVERLGGRVVCVDYVSNHSTTELVDRIRAGRPAHAPS